MRNSLINKNILESFILKNNIDFNEYHSNMSENER